MRGFFYVSSLLQCYSMKNSLFYLLALLCIQSSFGQASLTPDSALARLKNNYPQEKVFVQTDKAYYFPGETIWMKAWCTQDGVPTYLSRILYVEMVNGLGEVTQKKMYKLDSMGSTPVDMDVPPEIKIYSEIVGWKNLPEIKKNMLKCPYYKVSISDNGIGFDNIFSKKIFKLFQQLDKEEKPVSTKGTGLAIVEHIMLNHHGFVTATGTPGEGAFFNLFFPIEK